MPSRDKQDKELFTLVYSSGMFNEVLEMMEWTPCIGLQGAAVTTGAVWRVSDGLITPWEAAVAITDDTYTRRSVPYIVSGEEQFRRKWLTNLKSALASRWTAAFITDAKW